MNLNPRPRVASSDSPWPHAVVDDLIEPTLFSAVRDRVLKNAGTFLRDAYAGLDLQLQYLMDEELATLLFSDDAWALYERLAGRELVPNEEAAIQLRRMTPESPALPKHVDGMTPGAVAILYYLSDGWAPGRGGELTLFLREDDVAPAKVIEPLANRLVLLDLNDERYHAVNAVNDWTRHAVSINLQPRITRA